MSTTHFYLFLSCRKPRKITVIGNRSVYNQLQYISWAGYKKHNLIMCILKKRRALGSEMQYADSQARTLYRTC